MKTKTPIKQKAANRIKPVVSRRKFSVPEQEYLAAQRKAYKIWRAILEKEPQWRWDSSLDADNYVAQTSDGKFYTVCPSGSTDINTATGMLRFPDKRLADKFIKRMGTSIKHLCPKISFG